MDLKFYQNKKILLTGHTGFKGSWMCRLLLELGADVCGYSLNPPTTPALYDIADINDHIRSVIADIRDYDTLKKTFDEFQPEIVIHMAAQPIVRTSYKEPRYTYDVNVMGTVNVLECCRLTPSVKSIVNVTTDKVYRNDETNRAFREDEYLDGYDPYSNSKSCSELVSSSYRNSFLNDLDIPLSTCRAGNVIGGGDFATDRIVPDCYRAASCGKDIIVRNPYSTRPYQHVLEPVTAYLNVAMKQYANHSIAGSYNIGPDDESCINTGGLVDLFCEMWEKHSGHKPNWINKNEGGPHEAGFLKLDNSLYKSTFGYGPVWNITEALDKTAEWYSAYHRGDDIVPVMNRQIKQMTDSVK